MLRNRPVLGMAACLSMHCGPNREPDLEPQHSVEESHADRPHETRKLVTAQPTWLHLLALSLRSCSRMPVVTVQGMLTRASACAAAAACVDKQRLAADRPASPELVSKCGLSC